MRKGIIVVGGILLVVIAILWTTALGEIRLGFSSGRFGYIGLTPEGAAEERAKINTTYGLWFIVVLGATGALATLRGDREYKKQKPVTLESHEDLQKARQKKIAELKARLRELEEGDEEN